MVLKLMLLSQICWNCQYILTIVYEMGNLGKKKKKKLLDPPTICSCIWKKSNIQHPRIYLDQHNQHTDVHVTMCPNNVKLHNINSLNLSTTFVHCLVFLIKNTVEIWNPAGLLLTPILKWLQGINNMKTDP